VERTVVCEEEALTATAIVLVETEAAKKEAETPRPGLTMFTDGSRLDSGACGYAVAWKRGNQWRGQKVHMGYNQEAYDAECAAIVRALRVGAQRRKQHKVERITIFTDAQAGIKRMQTLAVGPGQTHAITARRDPRGNRLPGGDQVVPGP